jgi:predicted metal-dependent peptidase
MAKAKNQQKEETDQALKNFAAGARLVYEHPLFSSLYSGAEIIRREGSIPPGNGLAAVYQTGIIICHPRVRLNPPVWMHVIAHCLLHLGLEQFVVKEKQSLWNIACDCVVEKFLEDLHFGHAHYENRPPSGVSGEEKLYERLLWLDDLSEYIGYGTAGLRAADMIFKKPELHTYAARHTWSWSSRLAAGLGDAVHDAVEQAVSSQLEGGYHSWRRGNSQAETAREWFISSYPLLGAIATSFTIIESQEICRQKDIHIAAINCGLQEVYINPAAHLTMEECRFVMAHEFLHAALRHEVRHEWRDAYYWNIACDFVINGWLTEMGLGERPDGVLYDEQLQGLSAEAVYDRIVTDLRVYKKLATLRGEGLGDMLSGGASLGPGSGTDLDEFYRRALAQGLEYHQNAGRGYLPEGLIEEIRALSHPPIPWDVELARWFDELFAPLEKTRSYARPSRRQSSTPDIPRPSLSPNRAALDGRTFGVVLDTSGSMERALLATALGAIASYSASRDVPAVRVVFCDAAAYDQGYMRPEEIAGAVKVKGRGGTILQPGIDTIHQAEDFPAGAPLLLITDAECEDRLVLYGREHAFLIPEGATLPFVPKGKVFRMR